MRKTWPSSGPSLRVDRGAEEIVCGGVADVEMNGGVERCEIDKIGVAKVAVFVGRGSSQSFLAKFVDGAGRLNAKNLALFGAEVTAREVEVAKRDAGGGVLPGANKMNRQGRSRRINQGEIFVGARRQADFLAVIFAKNELAEFFQNNEGCLFRAVLTDELLPVGRGVGRLGARCRGRDGLRMAPRGE